MNDYERNLQEELAYLEKTLDFISRELKKEEENLIISREKLVASRRDMYENTVHFSNDFTRLTEMNQYQSEIHNQTFGYVHVLQRIEKYRKIVGSPYFGRFDFREEGGEREKIYVGLFNLMDPHTRNVYVYDWRAPISSIFYRFELEKAHYLAPMGTIAGDVLLKRQYKIVNSKLEYFFDCSIRINDEILQEILGRNTTAHMRTIVETIQKEQDIIIRDTAHDLLIVQGVAGSGKTSIALHRIAFLLYEGLNSRIGSHNIIIISPNTIFSKYISHVLPELGEENVEQMTFAEIITMALGDRFRIETREMQLESLINGQNCPQENFKRQCVEFKGSRVFAQILERLLWHYSHRVIAFEDVYFGGTLLETGQQLKNRFLNNKIGIPMAKQLERIEKMLLEKVRPLQKKRLERIKDIVAKRPEHQLEIKSFSRLLSIKGAKSFQESIKKYTRVDYWQLYSMLFEEKELLYNLSRGLKLPGDIEQIISSTKETLDTGNLNYEDCAPLLYLMLRIEGSSWFSEIRQVVIDEAQDYYPLQYEIFKILFKEAKYTLLGDVNQTIEKAADTTHYDDVTEILSKEKNIKLFMHTGYRSSYEINTFTSKLLGNQSPSISFERHEKEPIVEKKENLDLLDQAVIHDINSFSQQGYGSLAIICKTQREAVKIDERLKDHIKIKLIKPQSGIIEKGIMVIPSYLAKGLEFDAVIIYDANKEKYSSTLDRKLLYIACTRALHRLSIYYCGEKSPFLP